MEGLLTAHQAMKEGAVPAIIHAAAISYGFVFMHPFEDGNGRIHRFLIHNILFLRGAIPKGLMFPVSAAMLKNPALYDHSLEAFSSPLMRLVEYDLDDLGQMTVPGETGRLYRYIDMTAQAEALYDFVKLTIEHELVEELDFLVNYDRTKQAIQEIVDMPDRLIDLFIQLCLQNNGRLSTRKRESHFGFLTDDELASMESAVREGYASHQYIILWWSGRPWPPASSSGKRHLHLTKSLSGSDSSVASLLRMTEWLPPSGFSGTGICRGGTHVSARLRAHTRVRPYISGPPAEISSFQPLQALLHHAEGLPLLQEHESDIDSRGQGFEAYTPAWRCSRASSKRRSRCVWSSWRNARRNEPAARSSSQT